MTSITPLQAFGAQGIINSSSLCHLNCILVALFHCRLFRALVFRVVLSAAHISPRAPYPGTFRGVLEVLGVLQLTFVALEGGREGTFDSALNAEWLLSALAIKAGFQDANETLEDLLGKVYAGFVQADAAGLDALGLSNLAHTFSAMLVWRFADSIIDAASGALAAPAFASECFVLNVAAGQDASASLSARIAATLERSVGAPYSPEATASQPAGPQRRQLRDVVGPPPQMAAVFFPQRVAYASGALAINHARVPAPFSIDIRNIFYTRVAAVCALPSHYTSIASLQLSSSSAARAIGSVNTGELYFNDSVVNVILGDSADKFISKAGIMYFYQQTASVTTWPLEMRAAVVARSVGAAPLLMNVLCAAAGSSTRALTHWVPVTDASIAAASALDARMHAVMTSSPAPAASGFKREDSYLFSGSAVPSTAIDLFTTHWR